jgi:purine-binding chemotaxis protein CheW
VGDRFVGVGFVADRVFEVAGIDEAQIEPPPVVGGRWKSDYLAGIGKKGDGFVMIFDLAKLMTSGADVAAVAVAA